jgi:hypothetical protein
VRDIDNGVLTRAAAQQAVADAFREMAEQRHKHGPAEREATSK